MPSSTPAPPPLPPAAPTPSAPPTNERRARTLQLFAAWRAGDARAGEALFRELRVRLVVIFRGCPKHVVDDLVQDTLVACVVARDALRNEDAFLGYVRCVAYRALIHHRYRTRAFVGFDEEAMGEDRPASQPEDILDIRRLLCRRCSPHTLIVAMRHIEGHRGVAIASMLRISEASVRRRLRRGVDDLRRAAGVHPSA